VRDYAKQKGINELSAAVEQGMKEKAREFQEQEAEIYSKI
jgi:hypothetical protein